MLPHDLALVPRPSFLGAHHPARDWLYIRFTPSYRDMEQLLAERRLDLSYETIRRWVLKFGPLLARRLRQRRPRPGERLLAPRRDGGAGRWQADVPVACCRRLGASRHRRRPRPFHARFRRPRLVLG